MCEWISFMEYVTLPLQNLYFAYFFFQKEYVRERMLRSIWCCCLKYNWHYSTPSTLSKGKFISFISNRQKNQLIHSVYCIIETCFITLFSCSIIDKRFLGKKWIIIFVFAVGCAQQVPLNGSLFDQVSQCEWTMSKWACTRRMTNSCPGKPSALPPIYHLVRFQSLPDQKRRPLEGCNSIFKASLFIIFNDIE